jgi:ubiquinone/menaquinone biosynthesis C-methylase UbiE
MPEARYDPIADFYQDGWKDVYDDPVIVSLFELLGPVTDQRVLDVACGHGRITRELARRGAETVGLDVSLVLIERARSIEKEECLGVPYVHADIGSWKSSDSSFDAVTCCFGLSDIDDLDGSLRAVSGVLRPGGRFVFCVLHPCFVGAEGVSGS